MEERSRWWMLIVIGYYVRTSSAYATGTSQSQIYSFSYEIKNSSDEQWKSSNGIAKGTITRLNCITDSPSTTIIRRFNQSEQLSPLTHTEHHSLFEFGEISCDDMGTYVCDDGHNATKHLDLGILNCEPRLCADESSNKIRSVELHKSISLCIEAYPAISGIEIVEQTSNKLKTTSTKDFTWHTEKTSTEFCTYTLNITLTNVSRQEPEPNRLFDVVVLHTTKPKRQTLDVTLKVELDDPMSPSLSGKQVTVDSSTTSTTLIIAVALISAVVAGAVIVGIIVYIKRGRCRSKRTPLDDEQDPCMVNADSAVSVD